MSSSKNFLKDKKIEESSDVTANPRKGYPPKKQPNLEQQFLSRLKQIEDKLDIVLDLVYNKKEVSHG